MTLRERSDFAILVTTFSVLLAALVVAHFFSHLRSHHEFLQRQLFFCLELSVASMFSRASPRFTPN
jgi:hypothetical protein